MTEGRYVRCGVLSAVLLISGAARAEMGPLSLPLEAARERIEALRAMTERSPESADAWTELGWLLYRYGQDSDGAMEAADRACALDPEHFKANELAGRLAFLRGRNDLALDHWLKLLDHDLPQVDLYMRAIMGLARSQSDLERVIERLGRLAETHRSALSRTIARRHLAEHHLGLGEVDEAEALFRGMGQIENWMVIGPFANERNAGYGTVYGPEREIDFDASYQGRDRMVSWRPLEHLTLRRYVDFGAVMYPRDQVLGYAVTYLHSPAAQNATLRIGVREAVKVWFNDREVYASELERGFTPDQITIPLRLQAGHNKLLVKVGVEKRSWLLFVRLTDVEGAPLSGVTASRAPHDTPDESGGSPPVFDYALSMMDYFERAAESDPVDEDALYYLGLAQQANYLRTETSKTFERLERLNSRCSDHHRLLARAYLGDDKAEKALVQMKKGLEADPGNLRVRLMLARFYNARRLYRKEREVLDAIAERYPDWRDLAFQWLDHFSDRGWEELAFRKAKDLYESEPTDLRAAVTYARMCNGRGYAQEFDELLGRILKMAYTDTFARREALNRAVAEERVDDVLRLYDEMIRVDPVGSKIRLERARYLMSLKRYDEAIAQCRDALTICPENFAFYRELGVIHQRMHDEDAAMASFERALEYRPDDQWLREYVEFLAPTANAAFERYALGSDALEVLMRRPVTPAEYPRSDSALILDEMVTQVFEDGSSTYRIHQIIKVLDDAGRNQWTRAALPRATNRVERAVTIQPDGTEVEATSISGTTIHFAQLQPGSVIDYVVTGYAPANDWMSREYSEIFFLQSPDPMLLSRFVLLAPESKPVNTWHRGDMVSYATESFEGQTVHVWEARDVPRIQPEPNAPPLIDLCAQVRVSTIQDWNEIARWEHSLIKEQFEPDHDLRGQVATTTGGLASTLDKVRALANFVSQDIQYKILRGGIFGYKPNKAANVLQNEWGDCKDKATLLITMLDVVGIEAHYTTLRTRDQGRLVDEIPSNQCNHAIVYIPKQGDLDRALWVDGTALELGIGALPWSDQDVTAMVWDDDGSMSLMKTPLEPASNTISAMSFDVALRADGGADVAGRWTTQGQISGSMRSMFKQPGQRAERLTQVLNSFVPGSVVRDFTFSDLEDRDAPVEIDMQFVSSNYAVAGGREMTLRFKRPFRATAQFAPRDVRHYDVWLAFRQTQTFSETFDLPEGWEIASMPEPVKLETPWIEYAATLTARDRKLSVHRELVVKSITIPQADYGEFRRFCIALDEYEQQTVTLRRSGQ